MTQPPSPRVPLPHGAAPLAAAVPLRGAGPEATAREGAYQYLRQAIMAGDLPRGTRIVEERIAETLGLSRTPIRESLQRLRSEGLLVRVRRGQLEVATVGDEERAEIHLIRVAIDEVVARLLARRTARVSWPDLYALLEPLAAGLREPADRPAAFAMAHIDLHVAITRAAFSPRTVALLEGSARLYPADDYVQQRGYEPVAQHQELLDALSSGNESRAVTAALGHAMRGHAGMLTGELAGLDDRSRGAAGYPTSEGAQ
jgi:DNA-binding GntR family transcriptional regulator